VGGGGILQEHPQGPEDDACRELRDAQIDQGVPDAGVVVQHEGVGETQEVPEEAMAVGPGGHTGARAPRPARERGRPAGVYD